MSLSSRSVYVGLLWLCALVISLLLVLGTERTDRVRESFVAEAASRPTDGTPAESPKVLNLDESLEIVRSNEEHIIRPRSDWSRSLYRTVSSDGDERVPYVEGVSPLSRPFDNSDPEMRALVAEVYARGGCATQDGPCEAAAEVLRSGGNRVAAYLITQYERSVHDGYPNTVTYLTLIAHTHSDVGFEYVRNLVEESEGSRQARRHAMRALSRTGHPEATDIALRVIQTDPDPGILPTAINTLWKVAIATDELRPDVSDFLIDFSKDPLYGGYAALALRRLREHGFELPEDGDTR